jgi:imidazoleglycerol-phosphate dehydratase
MNPVVEMPEKLVEKVKQYQRIHGCSDQEMSKLLGCSRTTYNLTCNGRQKVGHAFCNGAVRLLSSTDKVTRGKRASIIERKTGETSITVALTIDGSGNYEINTGINMLDHLISQLARHGRFDIKLQATGDDPHHVAEDIAICLGQAFGKALGDKRGIVRMSDVTVPMDEALAMVAIDISGRGYTVLNLSLTGNDMFGFPTDLIRHFLGSLAIEGRFNLHARIIYGQNDHHKAEALFKALGRALDMATRIDERIGGELPSTKEFLEG